MKGKKLLALLLAALMVCCILTGCGGSTASENADMGYDMEVEMEAPEEVIYGSASTTSNSGTGSAVTSGQKLIKKVYIDAETEDLDTMLEQLNDHISKLGGYIESQEINNGSSYNHYRYRYASMTIRVPAENLSSFVTEVKGISNVVSYNENTDDVTLTYVSTESRITALEIEQERLLELLGKADNMTDLLEIEERLTEVRYDLENVTSQLRVLSNQVSYATIHLSMEQVEVYTEVEEPTVWERITSGFTGNLEDLWDGLVDFFVWAVTYSPQLLFWAVVITVAVMIVKKQMKKRREAKIPPYYPPQGKDEGEKK